MSEMDQGNTVAPTKLPWVAVGQQIRDTSEFGVSIAYCGTVGGAGVAKDGTIKSFGISDDEAKANAAFIVRAVNAFPEMLAALQKAEELYQVGLLNAPDGLAREVVNLRRAALSAAKGET